MSAVIEPTKSPEAWVTLLWMLVMRSVEVKGFCRETTVFACTSGVRPWQADKHERWRSKTHEVVCDSGGIKDSQVCVVQQLRGESVERRVEVQRHERLRERLDGGRSVDWPR